METKKVIIIKPPTTFEEQIELLKSRGLIINDTNLALETLKRYNYYRLSGYTLSLMENDVFHSGTTFEDIKRLYEFDAKLRILLMTIIEHVEIAFRTHTAYTIAHNYGPLGYKESSNFNDDESHSLFMQELNKLINKSKELFIIHHIEKYDNNFPVWVAFEVLTFGTLSKLFKILKTKDKKEIVNSYYSNNIYYTYIESWLYSLSIVRNVCAHYGRIYNKRFSIRPKFLDVDKKHNLKNNELFAVLYNLKYLMPDKVQWRQWVTHLEALIYEYNEIVDINLMGFPENWKNTIH